MNKEINYTNRISFFISFSYILRFSLSPETSSLSSKEHKLKQLIFAHKHVNNPFPYLRALLLLAARGLLIPKRRVGDTDFVAFMRPAWFVVHFMFVNYHVIHGSVLHDEKEMTVLDLLAGLDDSFIARDRKVRLKTRRKPR